MELQRRALALSYITVGYNILEGIVSIFFGSLAGSIALVGFGLDSFIESLSGGIMIWRFRAQNTLSCHEIEEREKKAIQLVGWTFFVLGAYILYESSEKLLLNEAPETSVAGMVIACISLISMPALFFAKRNTARKISSRSLAADSKQTLACAMLSVALLVGLSTHYWFGFWQADPIIGIFTAIFLFREGYTTRKESKLCSC